MPIARIITNSKMKGIVEFIEVTNDVTKVNDTIPTLIVGKKNAESLFGRENVHVLDKKIKENLWWTFSLLERRDEFENDIAIFNKMVIDNIGRNITYSFFNLFTENIGRIKKFITFMKNNESKIIYSTDRHLYIFYKHFVFGLSFDQTDFLGVKKEKIIKILNSIPSIVMINDESLAVSIKRMSADNIYLIPYFFHLKNVL